jgi:ketol-acid reductoisomerase
MVKKWADNDVTLDSIKNQTIAVIGYGIQGNAQANNLKDSGLNVVVGLRKGGSSWKIAEADGQNVMEVKKAVRIADIIHILIPDMEQAVAYKNEISPYLTENKALCFSHGASIHWGWIEPPTNVDVIMVAPKAPDKELENYFKRDLGHHL